MGLFVGSRLGCPALRRRLVAIVPRPRSEGSDDRSTRPPRPAPAATTPPSWGAVVAGGRPARRGPVPPTARAWAGSGPGDRTVTDRGPLVAIGRLLAPDTGAWRELLSRHVPDSSGHCRSCLSTALGAPVWPCRLRVIAEEAQRAAGELRGVGAADQPQAGESVPAVSSRQPSRPPAPTRPRPGPRASSRWR